MEISITEQGIVFLFSCVVGISLGIFYDVFRIFRVAFNPKWLIVFFQDIIFCIISSLIIILSIYYTNSGRVRLFGLAGCGICFVLYHLTVGSFVMFISKKIINFIKNLLRLLYGITIRPVKIVFAFVFKLLKKQIAFITSVGKKSKNHGVYLYTRRKTKNMALRGFDLYRDKKIPGKNQKLINEYLKKSTVSVNPEKQQKKKQVKGKGSNFNGKEKQIAGFYQQIEEKSKKKFFR